MNIVKTIVIVGAALSVSSPVFAARDLTQIMQQERAVKQLRAERGLAGPTGIQGKPGPATQSSRTSRNTGHPSERVRW